MLIGRETELQELEKRYHTAKFEFAVVYGRRRVGKTALLWQFASGKDATYFAAAETTARNNLAGLCQSIFEYTSKQPVQAVLPDWRTALETIFELAKTKRIVFVIDHYPFLAQSDHSFASTLQLMIDRYQDTSQLFLIVCGSPIPYMESHVLSYKTPLYGRRTLQMKIRPFDFFTSRLLMKGMDSQSQALFYGIVGGIPAYLRMIDSQKSVDQNIKELFLSPDSFFYEEPARLLKQELREPAIYNAILSSIARGNNKLNEIAGASGISTSSCSNDLHSLMELELVMKESPYGDQHSKKVVYSLKDNMLRFWYRHIPANINKIETSWTESVYKKIEADFSTYMEPVFEEICRQYLFRLAQAGRLPVDVDDLGRWWGPDPETKTEQEIDIVGADGSVYLFGECKWTQEPIDVQVLRTLEKRSQLIPSQQKYLYLFARTDFTEACRQAADQMGNVYLISFAQMIEDSDLTGR